jgi:fucose 4-O-acetylase-like acetyltransferase
LPWLDTARGIGILLVVYGHGARALPGILPHPATFRQIDEIVYAFHMPLFFLLAGLVSAKSLDRSRAKYLKGKFVTVVYPYVLWSAVYWILEIVFAREVNSPIEPDAILLIGWKPIEHLWFLYTLFVCQMVAAAAWPWRRLLAAISLWMLVGPLPAITVPAFWAEFPWFVVGLLLAPFAMNSDFELRRQLAPLSALAVAFAAAAWGLHGYAAWERVTVFLLAATGISLTLVCASLLQSNRVLGYLGAASLSIYLLHTIFSAGMRAFFFAFHPIDPLALLAVTLVAGIVGPLVIHEAARRADIAPYLGLGCLASEAVPRGLAPGQNSAEVNRQADATPGLRASGRISVSVPVHKHPERPQEDQDVKPE